MCFQSQLPHKSVDLVRIPNKNTFSSAGVIERRFAMRKAIRGCDRKTICDGKTICVLKLGRVGGQVEDTEGAARLADLNLRNRIGTASGGKSMCFQSQFPNRSVNLVRISNQNTFSSAGVVGTVARATSQGLLDLPPHTLLFPARKTDRCVS